MGLTKAGLGSFTPYHLRHSFATNLILQGISIYDLKELMRHESVNTTQIYLKVSGKNIDSAKATLNLYDLKVGKPSKFFVMEDE